MVDDEEEEEEEEEEERALLAVTFATKLLVASALDVVVKAELAASLTFRSALSKRFQRMEATGSVICEERKKKREREKREERREREREREERERREREKTEREENSGQQQ